MRPPPTLAEELHEDIDLPPRSRLAGLEPRARQTGLIESLTSYLMRVAASHHLFVGPVVLRWVRDPPVRRRVALRETNVVRDLCWANGTQGVAADWADWAGAATGRDLRELTLSPWSPVLPPLQVVDGYLRHCPDCLADWDRRDNLYEPLLWSLALATTCPIHRRVLADRCSNCDRRQPAMSFRSRPGICRHCSRFLGDTRRCESAGGWDAWVTEQLLGILAAPPAHCDPVQVGAAFAKGLGRLGLPHAVVAAEMGVARSSLSKWYRGQGRPSLAGVLRLAALGGWSTRGLLEGRLISDSRPDGPIRQSPWRGRSRKDWASVERLARQMTTAVPPPTVRAVAEASGCDVHSFRQQLPDLARALAGTRRDWVRERAAVRRTAAQRLVESIAVGLRQAGVRPSRRAVEAQLPHPLSLREPALQVAWRRCRARG